MKDPDKLSPAEVAEVRALLDRAACERCIDTYFHALDSRDLDLLDEVFAPQVEVADGNVISRGTLKKLFEGISTYRVSHHGRRNCRVTVDGDKAHANTFALDTLLLDAPPPTRDGASASWPVHDGWAGPVIREHGLRYVDDLERLPEGWRIVKRRGPIALWRLHSAGALAHPQVDEMRSAFWPPERKWAAVKDEG